MKLELKHIVGYLPYKLKMRHDYIKAKHGNEKTLRLWEMELNFTSASMAIREQDRRLILRPISDLIKEFEVNGEKFVPIEKYTKDIQEELLACLRDDTYYELLPLFVIEKLYEWHFDIHGLIEAGLAIDKNTL